ncbi:MAG: GDP-mannose 4,6-dehydratase [Nanoarchaeota archaeon]|nr:GDP-mannose 4,6-dehydratase [Nanoarchaeota archaeon]MBU1445318.1 GDP-mannose 4,6-dehydratase [Nanoarchaeota archaeon]MBU2420761.1 GDP-mannose 4,6-dehydratase [Nanoarchaeota archaeon]MBU2475294.1 GDP-mannose 4,6-dehydratase [Nanoarchaeota archaeon]
MVKKVLITGIAGHAGSHLADLLVKKGYDVHGITRYRTKLDNIEHLLNNIQLHSADITDARSVEIAVMEAQPEYIFHLAGMSFVPQSWRAPCHTMNVNVNGTINILEAARKLEGVKVQIAGSSEEYGEVRQGETPIKETNPLRPLSPYGVSKVATDLLGVQYHESYGTEVVITRGFNHTGPRHEKIALCPNIAWQIAQYERGNGPAKIHVDSLTSRRDFTDTRDMVNAYLLALEKGKSGEQYNICSGEEHSIEDVVRTFASLIDYGMEIITPKTHPRPSDVLVLQGDSSKFREETNWKPEIPFKKTCFDILKYWREKR